MMYFPGQGLGCEFLHMGFRRKGKDKAYLAGFLLAGMLVSNLFLFCGGSGFACSGFSASLGGQAGMAQ